MFLGTLIGGFSRRWTALATESACIVAGDAWCSRLKEGPATDLADQDVLRALPEGGTQEFIHIDLAPPVLRERVAGDARDPVRVREFQLTGILEGDDLCKRRDEERYSVQGRGLSGRRTACKYAGLAVLDREPDEGDPER